MSDVFQSLLRYVGVQPLKTSVYHPQTNGLVKRFSGTLKRMLRKFVGENDKDWPQWLPFLLFAIREVPQAFTGYSPFKLLYRCHPRGIPDVLREEWESSVPGGGSPSLYMAALQNRLKATAHLTHR